MFLFLEGFAVVVVSFVVFVPIGVVWWFRSLTWLQQVSRWHPNTKQVPHMSSSNSNNPKCYTKVANKYSQRPNSSKVERSTRSYGGDGSEEEREGERKERREREEKGRREVFPIYPIYLHILSYNFIYLHIPSYTSKHPQIPLYTFIYRHILQNIQY